MKKMMILAILLVATLAVNAQTTENNKSDSDLTPIEQFFIGKWKLFVEGLPQGDATMLLVIEKINGKYEGFIGGENGENPNKLTKVNIDKNTLNVNFIGGGYDIPVYLDKEKDGSISGSMNDMFDITGTKIVEDNK